MKKKPLAGSLGEALTRARRSVYPKLSQKEVAHRAGVSIGTIVNVENNLIEHPDFFLVLRLVRMYGVELNALQDCV